MKTWIQKSILMLLLVVSTVCLTGESASAQISRDPFDRPISRPTFSPYLNLFGRNGGRTPILNYYGQVRPQQSFYDQDQRLESGLERTQERFQRSQSQNTRRTTGTSNYRRYRMGITGHSTGFMKFSFGGGSGGSGDEGGQGGGSNGGGGPRPFSGHGAAFGRSYGPNTDSE